MTALPYDEPTVTVSTTTEQVVVEMVGELDVASSPQLSEKVEEALSGRPRELVIDLTQVTFLGSSGLRVLAMARRQAIDLGAGLVIRVSGSEVLRPLEVTGMIELLNVQVVPHP